MSNVEYSYRPVAVLSEGVYLGTLMLHRDDYSRYDSIKDSEVVTAGQFLTSSQLDSLWISRHVRITLIPSEDRKVEDED